MPSGLGRRLARAKIKRAIGRTEDYGLPKPGIERLDGDTVCFTDGTREQIDAITWATFTTVHGTACRSTSATT